MDSDIISYFEKISKDIEKIKFINSDDIPNIDLYMDQVTTFLDNGLKNTRYKEDEEKLLTKTMINNYAKNGLMPPPIKKKYNKEHLIILIFIYYFKNIISFSDIQMLLAPIIDKYFDKQAEVSLAEIYDNVMKIEKEQIIDMQEEILSKYELVQSSSTDEIEKSKDKEFLQMFSLICTLILDVYSKKKLIEKLIDEFDKKYGCKDDIDHKNKNKKSDKKK